jgi:hypothetical protein
LTIAYNVNFPIGIGIGNVVVCNQVHDKKKAYKSASQIKFIAGVSARVGVKDSLGLITCFRLHPLFASILHLR